MSTRIEISTWLSERQLATLDLLLQKHNDEMAAHGEKPITREEYIIGRLPSWLKDDYTQEFLQSKYKG
jgi:hypothetical protein